MSLQAYNKKRKFNKTPEPSGRTSRTKATLSFVIQRHKASRLHYDLRLEMDGVLKSWAVPKGPSLNPGDKRLAMMVEDHPFDYKDFSGVIPEGNYGAGIVEIWDNGTYSDLDGSDKKTAEKNLKAGLKAGNLKFTLHGKKLKGEFALVKLKGKDDNAWLLIKHKDEYAVTEEYNSEEYTPKNSPINKWLKENGNEQKGKGKEKEKGKGKEDPGEVNEEEDAVPVSKATRSRYLPAQTRKLSDFITPMMAKDTDMPFDDKDWIFEMKWDGYRAIAEINGSKIKLYSRNGNTFNESYPIVVEALKNLNINAVIDGEIVIVDSQGRPNFQLLQHYKNDNSHPIQYRIFDVLSINGENTCDVPLVDRKKLLKELLQGGNDVVKYSDHIEETGIDFFKAAGNADLEGIMAKKADSLYYPGMRTTEWLKIKHHKTIETIIAGFTEPTGGRKNFGALILGIRKGKKLIYVGHTGSGFTVSGLKEMSELLKPLIQKECPFEETVKTNMPATWVKPVLVCEIKYAEWTRDGHLRQPIFQRLRDDKKASEVSVEVLKPVKVKEKKQKQKQEPETEEVEIKPATKTRKKSTTKKEKGENESFLVFGKIKVKTTNRNKIFWPEEGITKGEVIDYYQSIAEYILPYLKDRPESLKRNPNGIGDTGFYHKDAGDEAPEWVKSHSVFSESTNKDIDYIICNNAATMAYLNNLGCIELNPWHSTYQKPDYPDYLIIDIDPSSKNSFEQVIETAQVIHDILEKAGADSYCKTSGATGLHVYVPTNKKYTYDQLKDFAHLICMMTQERLPEFTTLERNLKKRGDKMIYLDHLQNRRGQTISSVYSLRPKEGATVSMPLEWKEVKKGLTPKDFTIYNALERIKKKGDLFKGILGKGIDMDKCLNRLNK